MDGHITHRHQRIQYEDRMNQLTRIAMLTTVTKWYLVKSENQVAYTGQYVHISIAVGSC